MRLVFNRTFKSLTKFDAIEIPELTIITGVNGAGKSHLLEAIQNNAISIDDVTPNQPNGPQPIRRFDSNTLVPQDTGPFSAAQIAQEQSNFWTEIKQHREPHLNQVRDALRHFGVSTLDQYSIKELLALQPEDLQKIGIDAGIASQIKSTIANTAANADEHVKNMFVRNDPQNRSKLISSIAKSSRVPIFSMEEDDFFRDYPKLWQPTDLFQQSFARLFSAYQRQWSQNKLKELARKEGENVDFLSNEQFISKHGIAPWEFLNHILSVAELDFRINEPYKWDDRPYEPVLTDIKRNIRVKFNDLSSGERILMSFALCLYHAKDKNSSADFPKVILFDEIDAPLHPSMTRSLLRTIKQTLVDELKIKVILTTHSPSTVALAPSESIYVMHKHGENRLRATSKDAALGILTSGVPTLSVNYENRRQVFVESRYDVQYYNHLYDLSKSELDPEISITFIASGPGGNGDCEQVKSLVGQLSAGGNKTVVGVIDWDTRNASAGAILVLGEGERYSIENFLLDPILLCLLLLREKFITPDQVGLDSKFKYTDAENLSQEQIQSLADSLANKLSKFLNTNNSTETIDLTYSNGKSVKAPQWLATTQGHKLEQHLKEVFPSLLRYRNEPDLKLAIAQRVLDDFPGFMPASIVSLFKEIQRFGTIDV